MFIPFAEFRPDSADLGNGFSDELRNVLPADGSYIPMPTFSALTKPLPASPLGGLAVRAMDGTVAVFVGTADKLYRLDNTGLDFADVSQAGKSYHANDAARWSFAAFGSYIIAVNQNDSPQILQLGVDTRFRDLGGNPPRAGLVKIWGDFVCLMQLPDHPNRVHWSGLNDAEWWTVGARNCDFQDFADGGIVQGSTETTNPLVFLQSAIYLASFVPGSDIIFTFQKIHEKHGVFYPNSLATRGSQAFYATAGGFFQISNDGTQTAIGFEKIDRSIFARLNAANHGMVAVIDPVSPRVYWALDYEGKGLFKEMLVYDWGLARWSVVTIDLRDLMPIYQTGQTLEGLDNMGLSLDDLPFSLDSRFWGSGAPILGAFSEDNRLGAFSGAAMAAQLSLPEMGAPDGSLQWLMSAYPLVDSDKADLRIGTRMRRHQHAPIKWQQPRFASAQSGRYLIRARGRFHKIQMNLPAGDNWHHIRGIDVEMKPAGWR